MNPDIPSLVIFSWILRYSKYFLATCTALGPVSRAPGNYRAR